MAYKKSPRKKPAVRKKRSGTTTKTTYSKTNRRGKTKEISEKKYTKKTARLNKKGKAENSAKYTLDLSKKDKVTRTEKQTTAKKNRKGKTTKSFTRDTKKVTRVPKELPNIEKARIRSRKMKKVATRKPTRLRR